MAQVIKIKRSAVASKVPLTTDLQLGELAMNTNDGKLFMKKNNGTESIVEIGAVTASNVGASGAGVFNQKNGTNFEFKKLVAGTNMTVTDNGTTITLDAASSGGGGSNPANSIAPGVFIFSTTLNPGATQTNGTDPATTGVSNFPAGWSISVAGGIATITHNVGRPPKSILFWVGVTSTTNPTFTAIPGGAASSAGAVKIPASGTTALNTSTFSYQLVASGMGNIANGTTYTVVTF